MLKQYLIAKTFTRGGTPLEYEYTAEKCDMRTCHSKRREKYVWSASLEKLFKIVDLYSVKVKIGKSGEIRLIISGGTRAYSFLRAIHENGWKGE